MNQAIINILPIIGGNTQVYFTVILSDNSLNQATITSMNLMYGNATIKDDFFIANDNSPIALGVTAILNDITYFDILYTKAIFYNIIPDNFTRLIQKLPYGIFLAGTGLDTIVGQDMKARAMMIDDFYNEYFSSINQVYSTEYAPELEYEYNGTVGLLSNSVYPIQLFQILSALATVTLNVYNLELFISQYIFFRLDIISAVYIDDHDVNPDTTGWTLGISGHSELGYTTILSNNEITNITNLSWTIYNSSTFDSEFKTEITNLILRISRADIGNIVTFNDIVNPIDDGFNLIGATYKNDPRLIYGKCIQYIGVSEYPLNILGYQNTA